MHDWTSLVQSKNKSGRNNVQPQNHFEADNTSLKFNVQGIACFKCGDHGEPKTGSLDIVVSKLILAMGIVSLIISDLFATASPQISQLCNILISLCGWVFCYDTVKMGVLYPWRMESG